MAKSISYTKKGSGRVSGNKAGIAGYTITSTGTIVGRLPKGTIKFSKLLNKAHKKTLGLKYSN